MIPADPLDIAPVTRAEDPVVPGPGNDAGAFAAEPECTQETQYGAIVAAAEDEELLFRVCAQAD